jgi:hypothetical protein
MNDVLIAGAGLLIGYLGTILYARNRNKDTEFSLTFGGEIADSTPGETTPVASNETSPTIIQTLDLRQERFTPSDAIKAGLKFNRRRQFPELFYSAKDSGPRTVTATTYRMV